MSIINIDEWNDLTPEQRRNLAKALVEKYPSLFCKLLEEIDKCVCK